jgi:hypothetical protein
MLIQAKESLTKPSVPTTSYRSRYTAVSSRMYPRHYTAGSTRFYFDHWEAYKGRYQWRTKFYKVASQKYVSSYTLCSTSVKFPYTGKWRVVVRHADTSHYTSYSAYSYTTVR